MTVDDKDIFISRKDDSPSACIQLCSCADGRIGAACKATMRAAVAALLLAAGSARALSKKEFFKTACPVPSLNTHAWGSEIVDGVQHLTTIYEWEIQGVDKSIIKLDWEDDVTVEGMSGASYSLSANGGADAKEPPFVVQKTAFFDVCLSTLS
jgi:hypothetical protein